MIFIQFQSNIKVGGKLEPIFEKKSILILYLNIQIFYFGLKLCLIFVKPLLQAGGHGTTIAQCKSACITTSKTIPMQVDGEAARLNPSIINMTHLNQASLLVKRRGGKANSQ